MLRERYRPLAPMAVIEVPRVQLKNGLCRTIEKTDLSADDGLANNSSLATPRVSFKGVGQRPVLNSKAPEK